MDTFRQPMILSINDNQRIASTVMMGFTVLPTTALAFDIQCWYRRRARHYPLTTFDLMLFKVKSKNDNIEN